MAISCRPEVDQEAKEKPNPVSTQKSAYVDEDDDNELGDMLFHANVKEADFWSDDHARTVEQHPAIPRSVCDENTGALSATNSFALFASSSFSTHMPPEQLLASSGCSVRLVGPPVHTASSTCPYSKLPRSLRSVAGAYCSQKRRAAAPAAQFADEEEKGDKANEFVALKAPVFSSQTDLGIAG